METGIDKNQQVAVLANSLDVLKTGPQILEVNQDRKEKALSVGRNILAAIQEGGMTSELDERSMKYLANVKAAAKEMKEVRAGVTQIMDALRKMYTEVENELDASADGTIPKQIQDHRNAYAKEQARIAEEKRISAEREAAKQREIIDIKFSLEQLLSDHFSNYMLSKKQALHTGFNQMTLEIFEEKSAKLRAYQPKYSFSHFEDWFPVNTGRLVTAAEYSEIKKQVTEGKYQKFCEQYVMEISTVRDDLIQKLDSKLSELKEQKRLADESAAQARAASEAKGKAEKERAASAAKAAEEARVKADEDRKRREQEESDRIQKEAEDARIKAQQEAEIKKQGEETMVMFEKEAAIAENIPAPEARQGYEITILHPVGYTQIFAMWFEKVGKDLPVDKIGNTKLDQMKGWAEKEAHKTGTKIESKFLKYEETFKAINRKVTKSE